MERTSPNLCSKKACTARNTQPSFGCCSKILQRETKPLDAVEGAAMKPGLLDLIACRLLLADIDVELAWRRVIRADYYGPILLVRTGERILPGELTERWEFVA